MELQIPSLLRNCLLFSSLSPFFLLFSSISLCLFSPNPYPPFFISLPSLHSLFLPHSLFIVSFFLFCYFLLLSLLFLFFYILSCYFILPFLYSTLLFFLSSFLSSLLSLSTSLSSLLFPSPSITLCSLPIPLSISLPSLYSLLHPLLPVLSLFPFPSCLLYSHLHPLPHVLSLFLSLPLLTSPSSLPPLGIELPTSPRILQTLVLSS